MFLHVNEILVANVYNVTALREKPCDVAPLTGKRNCCTYQLDGGSDSSIVINDYIEYVLRLEIDFLFVNCARGDSLDKFTAVRVLSVQSGSMFL